MVAGINYELHPWDIPKEIAYHSEYDLSVDLTPHPKLAGDISADYFFGNSGAVSIINPLVFLRFGINMSARKNIEGQIF